MAKQRKAARDIYQEVTDQIVAYLDAGTAPWRNPIARGTGDGWPKNLQTGKRYRGINVMLLAMKSAAAGYASDYWMTIQASSGEERASSQRREGGTRYILENLRNQRQADCRAQNSASPATLHGVERRTN